MPNYRIPKAKLPHQNYHSIYDICNVSHFLSYVHKLIRNVIQFILIRFWPSNSAKWLYADQINHSWYWNPTCFQVENKILKLEDGSVYNFILPIQIFSKCICWGKNKEFGIFLMILNDWWQFLVLSRQIYIVFKCIINDDGFSYLYSFFCLYNLL